MTSPVATIELDAFCERCGFNLRSQAVWLDERLGLPVARCPECGRHHAAGKATSTGTPWLNRLALLGLLIWLALGIAFAIASFGTCLAVQAGASDLFLRRGFETADGRIVHMDFSNTTETSPGPAWMREPFFDSRGELLNEPQRIVPAADVLYRVGLSRQFAAPPGIHLRDVWTLEAILKFGVLLAIPTAAVTAIGIIAACAAWFWRPRWRAVWLALPIVAALVMGLIEWANLGSMYETRLARDNGIPFVGVGWIAANVAVVALLQLACLAIGLRFGRPVARLLLAIFIPPRSRQAFAFLWHCDRKTMPLASSPRSDR